MSDLRPEYRSNDATGTPRWVYVFGIISIVAVLMFVIMLFSGGDHGPGRHMNPPDTSAAREQRP